MRGRPRLIAGWMLPAAALMFAVGAGGTGDTPEPCCFVNRDYAGVCKVIPAQDVPCSDILAYLNNPASTGKTYCDSTPIRGGWTQVRCSQATPSPTAAGPYAERGAHAGPR